MSNLQTLLAAINDGAEQSLAARLRAESSAAEQAHNISDEAMHAMRNAGLFRIWRPKVYGGLELDAETGVRVFEELSRHDASAGWNAHISNVVDIYGAWFPESVGKRVFEGPDNVYSGALNPPFLATPDERDGVRGYTLQGRAPFASGVSHARWVLALAVAPSEAQGEGPPPVFFTLLPKDQLEVDQGSWETLGMGATGSFAVTAGDLFVPGDQFVPLAPRQFIAPHYDSQPLYRLSIWPLVSALGAPALGVARAAIDDLVALASFKVPFYTPRPLRERDVVQSRIGRAEAQLGSARAYFYQAIREASAAVAEPGSSLSQAHKHQIQLATCNAIESACEVVQTVFELAGSSGFRRGKDPRSDMQLRFEKYLREVNTMTQHAFGSKSRYESIGQIMLGLESDWPFFAF